MHSTAFFKTKRSSILPRRKTKQIRQFCNVKKIISNCPAGQPRHRAKDREFRAKHKGRMSQGSVAIGSTERVCWGIKGTVLFRKPRISQGKTQSLVEDHFSVILVWCCTICGFQSSLYNVFRSVKPKLFGCITSLHVL